VIRWVRPGNDFSPNFLISARSDVNGAGRIPLYQWMTVSITQSQDGSQLVPSPVEVPRTGCGFNGPSHDPDVLAHLRRGHPVELREGGARAAGLANPTLQTLFDRNGQPFRRYASTVEPFEIEEDINMLLAQ
jgi:glutathione peroxidase-family protein